MKFTSKTPNQSRHLWFRPKKKRWKSRIRYFQHGRLINARIRFRKWSVSRSREINYEWTYMNAWKWNSNAQETKSEEEEGEIEKDWCFGGKCLKFMYDCWVIKRREIKSNLTKSKQIFRLKRRMTSQDSWRVKMISDWKSDATWMN